MIKLKVRKSVDTVSPMLSKIERQLPFATALALTRTAQVARGALQAEMARVFVGPTRWTLGGIGLQPATKTNLKSRVYLKDDAGKGVPPAKYLQPEVEGGGRRYKRFEVALQRRGVLPPGWYAVPGRALELDGAGNVRAGVVTKILSDLGAFGEVGYTANRVTKRQARESGGARAYKRASRYFAVPPGKAGTPGIYEKRGDGLALLFLFVRAPKYSPRFKFYDVAQAAADRAFPAEFDRALRQAIGSAR